MVISIKKLSDKKRKGRTIVGYKEVVDLRLLI